MKPQLNHTIVWTRDRHAAAELMAEILDAGPTSEYGHFAQVETGNGVALDFADTDGDPSSTHLAFLVTERQFDEIFGRVTDLGLPYWADPMRSRPDEINHRDGGRGVYFGDPHTEVAWEILTRPYGSGPVTADTGG